MTLKCLLLVLFISWGAVGQFSGGFLSEHIHWQEFARVSYSVFAAWTANWVELCKIDADIRILLGVYTESHCHMRSINIDSNCPDSCQSCDRLTSPFDQLCRGRPTGSDLACCDRYCDRWSSGSLAIITLDLKACYLSHHLSQLGCQK